MIAHTLSRVSAPDGTDLAAYTVGSAGPWICLSNGLGGSLEAWRHLVTHFERKQHRILSWDYRGLYKSGKPAVAADVGVVTQVKDLLAVMDAAGVEKCIHIGWSMGVQVLLELYRMAPERVESLVLIGGAAGKPLSTVLGGGTVAQIARPIIDKLHQFEPFYRSLPPKAAAARFLVPMLRLTGLFSSTVDTDVLKDLAGDYLSLDFDCYLATLKALSEHDATDVLPAVAHPTLLIVGDKDLFTPPAVSEEMQRRIPQSELLVVRGGTHYAPIEFPELINLRIEKFLRERRSS